ncbi:MAG: PKD domain-containing protein [Bacteroidales bacterium]|nr:PKD domain-containing protein [Bacteroidales bacterium]
MQRKLFIFIYLLLVSILNSYAQDCNITSKANDMLPDKLCAPVTVTWEVTYRGVNNGGTPVEIVFNWDDGNPVQIVAATNTNVALKEWKATVVHVYPQGGPSCNYRPEATLRVNGVICTSSVQQQNVTVWDTDNYNGGHLEINPQIFPICVGNDGTVSFQDVSLWNCVPPVENDNPNDPTRWTQWIYGTNYTINGVLVNGVAQTYPYYGAIVPAIGPVYGPQPPNNTSLPVYAPNTALVGQFFEVTLRNWNYCNPYDDPNIPGPPADPINGDYPPITTTAIILIVPYPDATIQPAGPFCVNDGSVNLNAATPGGIWSGSGITNATAGTFNPSTAGPGTHTITYSVTDANGCTGTDNVQITVYARPNINMQPGTNLTVCPGDTLFLNANPTPGSGAIIGHLWSGQTTYLSATNIPNPYFVTNNAGTYNLTYRVTDENGCWRQQNVTIHVASVTANISPDPAHACAGMPMPLNGNPGGGTGNYIIHQWTGADTLLSNNNIVNPIFIAQQPGTYTLHYFVQDNLGCNGSDNITIQVSDVPHANAGINDSICGKNYNLQAIPSIGTGTWSIINGPGSAVFSDISLPSSQVSVTQFGTYTFQWQEVYGFGCTSKDTVIINFIQTPIANAGIDDSLCGKTTQLNATPSLGTGTWTLISGAGNITFADIHNPNTTITADNYGSYTFQWLENAGASCTDSDTVIINFDVVPIASFIPNNPDGCSPFNIQFQNTSQFGVNYEWYFSDNTTSNIENPSHTFYNTTNNDVSYSVQLIATSQYGCKDTVMSSLIVHPLPVSQFSHNASPQCSPVNVQFNNTSIGTVSYLWDFGDGQQSNAFNPNHTFINNTNLIQYFAVKLISTNLFGCTDTAIQYVTVYPDPNYNIIAQPTESCSPALIDFQTEPGAQEYLWSFGDGTNIQGNNIIQHQYVNTTQNAQIFQVQLIATNYFGCSDTVMTSITISPKPIANATSQAIDMCSPALYNFNNLSQGNVQSHWYWGDGSDEINNASSIQHTYTNSTNSIKQFVVSLVAINAFGCKDSFTLPINVYPSVLSQFNSPTNGCSPLNINFINNTTSNCTYLWNFGDGNTSTSQNPSHTYINQTSSQQNYTVSLIVTSTYGCKDTAQTTITVYPSPIAQLTIDHASGCAPYQAQFTNSSSGATSFLYQFGDNTSSTNTNSIIHHTYDNITNNPVTYQCNLIVQNNYACKDSTQLSITVYPRVVAQFTNDSTGCSPVNIHFNNHSLNAISYLWNFGDGSTSNMFEPNHTFINNTSNDITYPIQLTATSAYGCSQTYSKNIIVYAVPIASFTLDSSIFHFPNTTVLIDNTTQGMWQYIWTFGDGTTSTFIEPQQHTFPNWGDYTIHLIAYSNHCSDTVIQHIQIIPPAPIAHYEPSYASGCLPLTVNFTNQSLYATSYVWDFGDGNSSNEINPIYTYSTSGSYVVTLIATGPGGQDTYNAGSIDVFPNATAYFTVSPSVVFIPEQAVQCFNLSQNAQTYYWNFGDNTFSTDESPKHYYSNEGEYNITLIANNAYQCPDTFTIYRAVVAKSAGKIEFPSAFTPNPNGPNGGKYNPNDLNNDVFHPVFVGVEQYQLSIFNRWGELIFESTDPNIGWDGYYRNELCKQDVYVWKVKGKFINGQSFFKAGDVTLLR